MKDDNDTFRTLIGKMNVEMDDLEKTIKIKEHENLKLKSKIQTFNEEKQLLLSNYADYEELSSAKENLENDIQIKNAKILELHYIIEEYKKEIQSLQSNINNQEEMKKVFSQVIEENIAKAINPPKKREFVDMDIMDGGEFENFCAEILMEKGYENVEVTKGSGDQGVDIIAEKDGIRFAVQCKCYSNTVGNKAVQEVYSGKNFYNCQIGVVMTNNYFTKSAIELAASNGTILWDRDYLNKFIGIPSKSD